jgi:hypothetical protein
VCSSDLALAYALLLGNQFQPASAALKQIYDSGEQADGEGLPVLLAWAYLESGRDSDAAPLLRINPVPSPSGTGPFLTFYFPRIFYLRGLAADKAGKRDEAAADYQLFRKLSGSDPLVWGEESKASTR